MKFVATIAVAGLGIILLIQNLTTAGPSPSPRSVPIIVQDVMQPSRMVAMSIPAQAGGTIPVTLALSEGQVFILTSATFSSWSGSIEVLVANNVVDRTQIGDDIGFTNQRIYPTGIRVPRGQDGTVDLRFDITTGGLNGRISIHGYTTDDF